ncbi:adenosylmethionine decarboxylase [Rhodospirillales bacterium]|nr:adenosylmethionine decarboxylase [Rhodospirillales bacterium]
MIPDASISSGDEDKDFFVVRDGVRFAGTHLIIDVYGGSFLDDLKLVEDALRKAVDAAGATLLHIHLHHFTPNGGISGVAVLAESHISIHTWPECGYAALDVFMCGEANPHATIEILRDAFAPERIAVEEHLRGQGL